MAHMSVLLVDLTFGEVYDAPHRTPRAQRKETRIGAAIPPL